MSKYFNINNPSQIVTIISEQNIFYQLSDGNMIKKDSFMSKYQPVLEGFETEHLNENKSPSYINDDFVDPNSFFKSTVITSNDIDTIKQVDTSIVPDINDSMRSEIKLNTTDKTNTSNNLNTSDNITPNNTNIDVSKYKVYDNDEDAYNDFIKNSGIKEEKPQQIKQQSQIDPMIEINSLYDDELIAFGQEEANNRKNKRLSKLNTTSYIKTETETKQVENKPIINTIDPIKMMFSTFKRNHEIIFDIQFKDKIANPQFIKMMMENMEGDIIGYYKKIIMDNIMDNLDIIENVVENELKLILSEEKEIIKKSPKKRVLQKDPIPKTETEIIITSETSITKKNKTKNDKKTE